MIIQIEFDTQSDFSKQKVVKNTQIKTKIAIFIYFLIDCRNVRTKTSQQNKYCKQKNNETN